MTTEKDFVIDRLEWHLSFSRDYPETHARHRQVFGLYIHFVQNHGLARRTILPEGQAVPEDCELRKFDLTDEGFEFTRIVHPKWLRSLDRRKTEPDTRLLEKELVKFQKNRSAIADKGV